jgi:hypothetical protein
MAKDKEIELKYKIEGLKRMVRRKVKRCRKQRAKSLEKQKLSYYDGHEFDY